MLHIVVGGKLVYNPKLRRKTYAGTNIHTIRGQFTGCRTRGLHPQDIHPLGGGLAFVHGLGILSGKRSIRPKDGYGDDERLFMADRVGRLHGSGVRIGQAGQVAVIRGHAVPGARLVRGGRGNYFSTLALRGNYVFRRGADSHRGIDDFAARGRLDRHGVHHEERFLFSRWDSVDRVLRGLGIYRMQHDLRVFSGLGVLFRNGSFCGGIGIVYDFQRDAPLPPEPARRGVLGLVFGRGPDVLVHSSGPDGSYGQRLIRIFRDFILRLPRVRTSGGFFFKRDDYPGGLVLYTPISN